MLFKVAFRCICNSVCSIRVLAKISDPYYQELIIERRVSNSDIQCRLSKISAFIPLALLDKFLDFHCVIP